MNEPSHFGSRYQAVVSTSTKSGNSAETFATLVPGDKGSLVGRRHRESYSIGFCEVLAEGTRKVHRPGFGTGSEMDSYIRGNVFFLWNDGKINPLARTPGNLITFIKYFFFPFQCLVKIKNRRQISLHYMFLCV